MLRCHVDEHTYTDTNTPVSKDASWGWGGGAEFPVRHINAFKSPELTFECAQILMAGWVIDCVWSNGIKRQRWPWAGHSGGDGSGGLGDGEKI